MARHATYGSPSIGDALIKRGHADGREEGASVCRPSARRPIPPRVIARGRDGKRPAHQLDGIATVVLLDRAVSHGDSLAQNAAARLNKSRSFRRVSFSLQRYSTVSAIPSSRATWATGRPDSRVSRTASDLNASVH
jgi:hypothetical protein